MTEQRPALDDDSTADIAASFADGNHVEVAAFEFATEPFDLAAPHLRFFFGGWTRWRSLCFSALSLSLRVTGRWLILRRILEGIPIRQRPRL